MGDRCDRILLRCGKHASRLIIMGEENEAQTQRRLNRCYTRYDECRRRYGYPEMGESSMDDELIKKRAVFGAVLGYSLAVFLKTTRLVIIRERSQAADGKSFSEALLSALSDSAKPDLFNLLSAGVIAATESRGTTKLLPRSLHL